MIEAERQRPSRILITGAAGSIGTSLRVGIHGVGSSLRLTDRRPLAAAGKGEEVVVADLNDAEQALAVTRGVDCVVHLAGVPREDAWEPILRGNIEAVYNLFEAARINAVRRLIFASSNHVIGFHRAERIVGAATPPRPDSRYAVSKLFGEALGRMYADKHGLEVACLRIGSFRPHPENERQLATWISPADLTSLVRRCLEAPRFHYLIVYGASANVRNRWGDDDRAVVGYRPADSADDHASLLTAEGEDASLAALFHGGNNCVREFSGRIEDID